MYHVPANAPNRNGAPAPAESMASNHIVRYLSAQDIWLDLQVADKHELFDAIGRHMEREHALSHRRVVASLSRREQAASTGVGHGVAIPHARLDGLERILIAYARLAWAIPFDAPDRKPVLHVVVLLVPSPASDEHLTMLAELAELFSDGGFRERLEVSTATNEVLRHFATWTTSR